MLGWAGMTPRACPFALSLCIAAAGCADPEPAPAEAAPAEEAPVTEMEAQNSSEAAQLELTVDGRSEPMAAQARFGVVEGMRRVTLTITGTDAEDNLVMINLEFDGLENVAGQHTLSLGSPEMDGPHAIATFEAQVYESPSGEVELSVSRDGSISGQFDIPLSQASPGAAEAAALEPLTAISGAFDGRWIINCMSPIRGFTGGHAVSDSPYCNGLEL